MWTIFFVRRSVPELVGLPISILKLFFYEAFNQANFSSRPQFGHFLADLQNWPPNRSNW